jgi:hypothetical protein
MNADFPAAHSMDTVWFAVDADGHVACFWTGEDGCLPVAASTNDDAVRSWIRSLIPDPELEDLYVEYEDYARAGLFNYDSGYVWTGIAAPYQKNLVPDSPLHIDQVPPAVRDVFKHFRLDNIRFTDTLLVQPWEYGTCDSYGEDETTGYLAGDGVTVRPVPGRERDFLEDYELRRQEMQQDNPDLLQRLHFALPRKEDLPPDEDDCDEAD